MKNNKKLENFPVFFFKEFILSAVMKYKILFISAETGSGKTTIIPQILFHRGFFKKIIISQTKKLSTLSSAKFVSSFFNSRLGQQVGYSVRFDDFTNKNTSIKFVTDGILYKEIAKKSFFGDDLCMIIDEFHERTISTDLLLAFIKKVFFLGKIKRLVIMSASGNSHKIANFFQTKVGKLILPGKLFKVSVFYLRFSQSNYIFSTIVTILKIHKYIKKKGDILVFLPGLNEIEKVFHQIFLFSKEKNKNFFLCKLYASLPFLDQRKCLESSPDGFRKIILSTNVAESSLTIPGITFVIDCGLSKQKILNWKNSIELFRIFPISKSEIYQRSGRAGRQRKGKCYRLFTFSHFKKLHLYPKPEIERIEMTEIILSIISFSNRNLFDLDFISLPSKWGIIRSLEFLFILGAIDKNLFLTFFGKCMSIFPIEIKLSKSIIEALRFNDKKLISWITAAASSFSTNSFPFITNYANLFGNNLENMGDFFLFAKIILKFKTQEDLKNKNGGFFLKNNNLNFLKTAWDINKQILRFCSFLKVYFQKLSTKKFEDLPFIVKFKVCFVSGFFINSARITKNKQKFQIITSSIFCNIHPQSLIQKFNFKVLVFKEIFLTNVTYIRGILPIRLIWLLFFGNKIFK
ncbi:cdc28 (nucleomorph) [Hemiselmis andersenii]|uniref:Cdc28 n=2 Tax=Hemiselmis andersenii TaxID=464988 RepID=A9BKL9_HEMAN|nr:cdc28 [Hemiselmis andersenii]ABW98024.1 cdc28 [Hemiselmis andersenii]